MPIICNLEKPLLPVLRNLLEETKTRTTSTWLLRSMNQTQSMQSQVSFERFHAVRNRSGEDRNSIWEDAFKTSTAEHKNSGLLEQQQRGAW